MTSEHRPIADGGGPALRVALDVSSAIDPRPTGVARYLHGLVAGLSEDGSFDLTLLCRASRWRRGDPPAAFAGRRVVRWLDWVRPRGFDVFHAPDLRAPRRPPPGLVVTVHDLSALDRDDHAGSRFLARKRGQLERLPFLDARVITHTETMRRSLIERLGLAPDRTTAVGLWPALPARTDDDAVAKDAPDRAPLDELLVIGGPSPRKRSDRIAGLLARLEAETGLRPRVAWCGSADDATAARFLGGLAPEIRTRIRWLGHIPDAALDRRLSVCGGFLQLSDTEGFGIPLLEAAVRGRPILVARSATAEEVLPADGAFWCGGHDEAEQLRAFGDPDERARRAAIASRAARGRTRDRTVRETAAVYRIAAGRDLTRRATAAAG